VYRLKEREEKEKDKNSLLHCRLT